MPAACQRCPSTQAKSACQRPARRLFKFGLFLFAFLLLDGKYLLGVGRLAADPGFEQAEFALVVASDRQRKGYGELLLRHVLAYAKTRGIQRVIGMVLRENRKMLHLAERLGFKRETGMGDGNCLRVVKFLGEL